MKWVVGGVVVLAMVAAVITLLGGFGTTAPTAAVPSAAAVSGTETLPGPGKGVVSPVSLPATVAPSSAPTVSGAQLEGEEGARLVAEGFAAVYARPAADQVEGWSDQVSAWVSDALRVDLQQISPTMVPYTQVAGRARLVSRGPAWGMFGYVVPTDGPDLTVTVGPDPDSGVLLIWAIDLGGRA